MFATARTQVDRINRSVVFENLQITSSNFPQYDRNPNTGDPQGANDKLRVAHQKVLHSAQFQSHIVLPVVMLLFMKMAILLS